MSNEKRDIPVREMTATITGEAGRFLNALDAARRTDYRPGRGWRVEDDGLGAVHVLPEGDCYEHSTDPDRPCGCQPRIERYRRRLIIHNSADRREQFEPAPATLPPPRSVPVA